MCEKKVCAVLNECMRNNQLSLAEGLRRLLWVWIAATRCKRLLADREEEVQRSRLLRAWESWRDRYIENGLRNIVCPSQEERLRSNLLPPQEMDVVLQSHTNLSFKTFRVWEAKATVHKTLLVADHKLTSFADAPSGPVLCSSRKAQNVEEVACSDAPCTQGQRGTRAR